ncbi:MAG: leucine-rich repeat protein [Eubacteriales bacterium]
MSEIGYNAFIASGSLLTLTIPRNITHLDGSMILWCSTLTDLYLPDTIKDYSNTGFHGCDNLTVHCSENNPIYQYYKDKLYRIKYKFALDYK